MQRVVFAFILLLQSVQILFAQTSTSTKDQSAVRAEFNLNTDWAFYRGDLQGAAAVNFNDRNWYSVTIPHTMRLEKKHNGGANVYQGVGWYRRYFKADKSFQEKRVTLKFDGVQINCEVFLNGEKLATHYGGYLGFVVDITNKLKFNTSNVLAVRVSNTHDPLTPP